MRKSTQIQKPIIRKDVSLYTYIFTIQNTPVYFFNKDTYHTDYVLITTL